MMRATAIVLSIAAVVGCSYIGYTDAAEPTASVPCSVIAKTRHQNFDNSVPGGEAMLLAACQQGVKMREAGAKPSLLIEAMAITAKDNGSAEDIAASALVVNVAAMGYAVGTSD